MWLVRGPGYGDHVPSDDILVSRRPIHHDGVVMMQRTQITLDRVEHRRARRRASELGISLAEYIRRLIHEDLDQPMPNADVSALFDLGDSGESDIAASKDAYVGAAFASDEDRAGGER